jgi:hypothetical protein
MAKKNRNDETQYDEGEGEVVTDESTATDAEGETSLPKTAPFCAVSQNEEGALLFRFANGNEHSLNPNELSEEIQNQLKYHGATQKLRDSFSSAKGDFAYAEGVLSKVIQQLRDGYWTGSRASGETKPKTGELAQALANLKGVDLDTAQAAVERASEEKRKTWRSNASVAAEIASIRAENAKKRAKAVAAVPVELD